jgi:hypothetical protein
VAEAEKQRLPGSFDFEGAEAFAFALGKRMLDDFVDATATWATVERVAQVGEGFKIAGGYDFDVAVFGVADPAFELELAGLAMDEPAEAYALDSASD